MTTTYLEDVLDSIESKHCVVLLGPNVPRVSDGRLLRDAVFEYAQANFPVTRDSEGLLHFQSGRDQTRYPNLYKRFALKKAHQALLYSQLADLPIHLYVSLTPDHLLAQAFDQKGIGYQTASYHKGKPQPALITQPTPEQPLIYNLFGSLHEPDSLVYTQDDLFDFLFSVLGSDFPIPSQILHSISSARLFLFLGFEFDQWYLKLLLRLFQLHQKRIALAIGVASNDDEVQTFYQDQFEMVFVPQAFEEYITKVHGRWPERQPYRQSESGERNLSARILDCLRGGDLEEGLDLLNQFLEARESAETDTAVMLSGQYINTQRKLDRGMLSEEEASRTFARIQAGVVNLVNQEA